MTDAFDPIRFLDAQAPVHAHALGELRAGRKRTHWMWFVFPQLAGLGHSPTARYYALPDLTAAQDYAAHAILGPRLRDCTRAALLHAPGSAAPVSVDAMFGHPDNLKFHSSMTLFRHAAPDEPLFVEALAAFFAGAEDEATLARL